MPTQKLLGGIGRFHDHYRQSEAPFHRLAVEGQAPDVLFIGCSDSRVAPELITGAEAGDLFVVRNVANIVPPYGTGQMGASAAIEYAVMSLHVPHVVICGHTDCGGIHALRGQPDWRREPHMARWIEYARPAQTTVDAAGLPEEARHVATVRKNVLLQLEHLRSYDAVREGTRDGTLALHGWVYHLETGQVEAYDAATGSWQPLLPEAPPRLDSNEDEGN
ncbi:MAG: carbonic anhydrase [Anaerolineae bacterium]|jgi:carbonic anhydrase